MNASRRESLAILANTTTEHRASSFEGSRRPMEQDCVPLRAGRLRRCGSVLLAVMVVLLLVGLLGLQSVRWLALQARGQRQRAELAQARELIELGRLRLQAQLGKEKSYNGESLEIDFDEPALGRVATIHIMPVENVNGRQGWQITQSYAGVSGQSTARWESYP